MLNYENPQSRWAGVFVKDVMVLDIGAGDFGNSATVSKTSPHYWLEAGASNVAAVDANEEDISYFVDDKRIASRCMLIQSHVEIEQLIEEFNPSVVKYDIQDKEVLFSFASGDVLRTVRTYAIRTYSENNANSIVSLFQEMGYETTVSVEDGPPFSAIVLCSRQ